MNNNEEAGYSLINTKQMRISKIVTNIVGRPDCLRSASPNPSLLVYANIVRICYEWHQTDAGN